MDPNVWRSLGQASMVGVTLAACIFVGVGLGVGLDAWLHTRPWFTLILMVAGIVAGFYQVIRLLKTLVKSNPKT